MTEFSDRLEARLRSRSDLLDLIDRLIAEFPQHPAGVIIRIVVTARERALHDHRYRDLNSQVERMSRFRIATAMPARAG